VQAEWQSLEPRSDVGASTTAVRGAVLLRPGARFEVIDGLVAADGPVAVDRGAHVHDPWAPLGTLLEASTAGRPPFPRRPVVVFAATENDPVVADWARRLVNRLVRREIEARLALPAVEDGLHLTRPCLVGTASIEALAADVIVTLDRGAAAEAARWCASNRATVVIELVDDVEITQRLVSWQIAHARGRVRAQISRRIGAPSLARLVARLSSGPQPGPPTDAAADDAASPPVVRENWVEARPNTRPSCVILTGGRGGSSARVAGLVDHLEAAGVGVTTASADTGLPGTAAGATLVVLVGADRSPGVGELIATRAARRLATVLDLDSSAFHPSSDVNGESVGVSPEVLRLAQECGHATTPTEAGRAALRRSGVPTLTLPSMLPRARAAALRAAGAEAYAGTARSIGWHVGSAPEPVPDYADAVGDGIAKLLADRPDLRVDIVGDPDRAPEALRRNRRVTFVSEAEPDVVAAWDLHVWTPRTGAGEVVDDIRPLVEASAAAVASVLPLAARSSMDGFAANKVVVSRSEESEGWATALRRLLDDDRGRRNAGLEARRWAHAVHGPPACRMLVNRLLGWARYEVQQ
jgi:hypothetical protein